MKNRGVLGPEDVVLAAGTFDIGSDDYLAVSKEGDEVCLTMFGYRGEEAPAFKERVCYFSKAEAVQLAKQLINWGYLDDEPRRIDVVRSQAHQEGYIAGRANAIRVAALGWRNMSHGVDQTICKCCGDFKPEEE